MHLNHLFQSRPLYLQIQPLLILLLFLQIAWILRVLFLRKRVNLIGRIYTGSLLEHCKRPLLHQSPLKPLNSFQSRPQPLLQP
jgi:hypothetical protein